MRLWKDAPESSYLEYLKHLLDEMETMTASDLKEFASKPLLLKNVLDSNTASIQELTAKFANTQSLSFLLKNEKFFRILIEAEALTEKSLKNLLITLSSWEELDSLCENTSLITKILKDFILNKKLVENFNKLIEKDESRREIQNIFDLIDYYNKDNKKTLSLNDLNRCIYSFNKRQARELTKILKNDEIAKSRLKEIVDNHLESNYDFDSLMSCLKKKEKKNVLNI